MPKYIKNSHSSTIGTIKTTSNSIKKGKDLIFSNKEEQMTNNDICLVLVFLREEIHIERENLN